MNETRTSAWFAPGPDLEDVIRSKYRDVATGEEPSPIGDRLLAAVRRQAQIRHRLTCARAVRRAGRRRPAEVAHRRRTGRRLEIVMRQIGRAHEMCR